MAVHEKNISFAEEQRKRIAESVINTTTNISPSLKEEPSIPADSAPVTQTVTTTKTESRQKRKDVLIGVHVTEEERNDLRNMFCSKGCSLAVAYRAAMSYLKEDLAKGKAQITNNGDIIRIS